VIDEHWPTAIYHAGLEVDIQAIADAMHAGRGRENYAGGFSFNIRNLRDD
jgi:predicted alpha/beta-fold hydrolase